MVKRIISTVFPLVNFLDSFALACSFLLSGLGVYLPICKVSLLRQLFEKPQLTLKLLQKKLEGASAETPPERALPGTLTGGSPLSFRAPLRMMLSSMFPAERHCGCIAAMQPSDSDRGPMDCLPGLTMDVPCHHGLV